MPSDPKKWTAKQWAEWAAGFLGWPKGKGSVNIFDPLHDLNHLGLILDEIERRVEGSPGLWRLSRNEHGYLFETFSDGASASTLNLAVLLAAKALEDSE